MAQRVRQRAVSAGALSEHSAPPGAATTVAPLDSRQHLMEQIVLPSTGARRVDVLIATKPSEAIGKRDDDRRHALLTNQPVESLRQVLAKADPVCMGQAAARESDEVDEQRQPFSVMPG